MFIYEQFYGYPIAFEMNKGTKSRDTELYKEFQSPNSEIFSILWEYLRYNLVKMKIFPINLTIGFQKGNSHCVPPSAPWEMIKWPFTIAILSFG